MDSLPGAAALARGLLVLARSKQSGVLTVVEEHVSAKVGVRDGRVVAMRVAPDDGDTVGAELRRIGAWDESRAESAGPLPPGCAVGAWGIQIGATSEAAVSHALRRQLRRRMGRLFALDPPELRLRTGSADVGVPQLTEPPTSAELIVAALRDRVANAPLWAVRRRLGSGLLVLTSLGRELLTDTPLWPDEHAMMPGLIRGASVDELLSTAGSTDRAQRTLFALKLIGACGPPEPRKAGYAMLLRKTRQVRRGADPKELLELPNGHDPRRALRKIASAVHPDRFGADAQPAIQSASTRVMSALIEAERSLR